MKSDTILLDRYQICEEISHKAGRRTFLARDLQNQQSVILKILEFNQFFQWEDLKLFEREVQTLQNLDHPAIPKYLDSFEIQLENARGFALVQTYIDAPSLETVIQDGRKFSDTEIKEIAQRLLEILIYLHEQNPPVIHRDIKPSNILLTNRSGNSVGDIYLVDFGSVQTVVSEYKKFIFLVTIADRELTPSPAVDRVWHLHLLYTRSYWEEFCGKVLDRKLHHLPGSGRKEDGLKYYRQYCHTLELYEKYFGKPPIDIWNPPKFKGEAVSFQWVDRNRYWILPKISILGWLSKLWKRPR